MTTIETDVLRTAASGIAAGWIACIMFSGLLYNEERELDKVRYDRKWSQQARWRKRFLLSLVLGWTWPFAIPCFIISKGAEILVQALADTFGPDKKGNDDNDETTEPR